MSSDTLISVRNVSKAYRIWESPSARLTAPMLEGMTNLLPENSKAQHWLKQRATCRYRDFYALHDISFTVGRGESVGIIGRNGSGKSTLLQIIAGTLTPTAGSVKVNGRVAALLELGSGFNPEFTGRENVFLNGAILGLTRKEVEERFDAIAAFADIGDFIDQPVKTYSSGMQVRLAFAVQTSVEPDVFIVDEALSVGDFFFQQKCFRRIAELRARGTTILFVSHDMGSVRDLCQKCLYLRGGQTEFCGSQHDAIRRYFAEDTPATTGGDGILAKELSAAGQTVAQFLSAVTWGSGDPLPGPAKRLRIRAVRFLDESGQLTVIFTMGFHASLELLVTADQDTIAHIACTVLDREKQTVTCLGTYTAASGPVKLARGESAIVAIRLQLNFEAGQYSLFFTAGGPGLRPNRGSGEVYDATPVLGPIEIKWNYEEAPAPFLGRFGPPVTVTVSKTTD